MVFFALDFDTRKKNQTSGAFFVDGFFKEGPKTLDQLQSEIANGNTQWLKKEYVITPIEYLDLQDIGEPKELKYTLGSTIILK